MLFFNRTMIFLVWQCAILCWYQWFRCSTSIIKLKSNYSTFNKFSTRCCLSRVNNHVLIVFFCYFRFCFRNPQVQSKGLELGFIPSLLRLLNIETDSNTKNRLVFALSTLIRNFPRGQDNFVRHGGIETLLKLFDQSEPNSRLKIRTIELLGDLIEEKVK